MYIILYIAIAISIRLPSSTGSDALMGSVVFMTALHAITTDRPSRTDPPEQEVKIAIPQRKTAGQRAITAGQQDNNA